MVRYLSCTSDARIFTLSATSTTDPATINLAWEKIVMTGNKELVQTSIKDTEWSCITSPLVHLASGNGRAELIPLLLEIFETGKCDVLDPRTGIYYLSLIYYF